MKVFIILIPILLITGCKIKITNPFEYEHTDENGDKFCVIGLKNFGLEDMLFRDWCNDKVTYKDQINNSDNNRFDIDSYNQVVSDSLEGKWMVFDTTGTGGVDKPSNLKTRYREVCDVELKEGKYNLSCEHLSSFEMDYKEELSSVDISTSVREGEFEREKYKVTSIFSGLVTSMNRIDFTRTRTVEYENGDRFEDVDELFSMIKIGDLDNILGTINIIKRDYEGEELLNKTFNISYILEGEKTDQDYKIKYFDENREILGQTLTDIKIPKGTFGENEVPYKSGRDFYRLYDRYSRFLRYRQFDYIQNDAQRLEIQYKENLVQPDRYKRPTYEGKINLNFSE